MSIWPFIIHNNNNNDNDEFLYSPHTILYELHTHHPWSLDLFIHVPFQLSFLEHTTLAAISALGINRTYFSFLLQMFLLVREIKRLRRAAGMSSTFQWYEFIKQSDMS